MLDTAVAAMHQYRFDLSSRQMGVGLVLPELDLGRIDDGGWFDDKLKAYPPTGWKPIMNLVRCAVDRLEAYPTLSDALSTGWKPFPRDDRLEAYPTRLEAYPTRLEAYPTRLEAYPTG
jgi:hypothetical protein